MMPCHESKAVYHQRRTAPESRVAVGNDNNVELLVLSAAFDTVDHSILISRLQSTFDIDGTVLSWITSFITDRTQTVNFAGQQSTTCCVECRREEF